jgi:hypothetical protein
MSTSTSIRGVNFVLAVGSVDGVCTAAAVLRNAAPGSRIAFCQAFTVDKVDPTTWGERKEVLFVDLAVNNRDEAMTVSLLKRVVEAGHRIVGVCDEHNAADWAKAFAAAALDFDALQIKPVSGKGTLVNSSGALLLSLLGTDADEHTQELCAAADAGDRMDFSTRFGGMVNAAVKSRIADDTRRAHLALHLAAGNTEPDSLIQGWIKEYEVILHNHEEIVAARQDLGDGLVRVVTLGKTIDVTTFMSQLYKLGYKIVVVDGEAFNPAKKAKERQISFGCAPQIKVDLVAGLKTAGITASGFAQKANVSPDDEAAAIAVVKKLLAMNSLVDRLTE